MMIEDGNMTKDDDSKIGAEVKMSEPKTEVFMRCSTCGEWVLTNNITTHFAKMHNPPPRRPVYNTDVKTKREHFPVFAKLIANQFKHGGDKYALDGQPDKEYTDLICEMSPGKTGFDWIFQTMAKYGGRYMNFGREKDLLKIATFAYIAWLKGGHHLSEKHDEDISRDGKGDNGA